MRTSSSFANAKLTHAFSSPIADSDARPSAGPALSLFFGRENRCSYLPGRPDALPRHGRAPSRARTTRHQHPHPRDLQEKTR
jgi:hypothetical protein